MGMYALQVGFGMLLALLVSNLLLLDQSLYQFTLGLQAAFYAGGLKPDAYLGQVLISRLEPDSTRSQLRTALASAP
jgi:hypothetical protein